jgi:D-3-phosphoglycerate dehydrogenase / 2-oxoglutarate reductase
MTTPPKVLLTDHPWPGADVERDILTQAGLQLIEAPPDATTEHLAELATDVAGILTCWAPVPRAIITASAGLRVVTRLGVGLDNINLAAARQQGAVVTYVPDYCIEEVSDHVVALTYSWARHLPWYHDEIRAGRWQPCTRLPRRIADLKMLVWGSGRIGTRTAAKFRALGCAVTALTRSCMGRLEEYLQSSDVVSLHLPYRPTTHHIVDAGVLATMKPGSLLVNTARGGLVDTAALLNALDEGRPGAAALDVVEGEPFLEPAVRDHPAVFLTPHIGFSSERSVTELRQRACTDVVRVLHGKPPLNPVPPPASEPPT